MFQLVAGGGDLIRQIIYLLLNGLKLPTGLVFQPASPIIRGRIGACLEAESALDVEGLIERSVAGVERTDLTW